MRGWFGRRVLSIAALTVVWLMLWDRISVANAASGVVVAIVVLTVFPTARRVRDAHPIVIRPLPTIRLFGYIAKQLVISNVLVAREIVTRSSRIRTGIVACRMHTDSPGLVTLIANILQISPGTMTVDVHAEPATIYVHVLMLRDVVSARRAVAHLEKLVLAAFGTDADYIDRPVSA